MKKPIFSRFFRFKKTSFSRSFDRIPFHLDGTISFLEYGYSIDGYLEEISLGGCLFRPAQTFVMYRDEGLLRLSAGNLVIEAELRNTSARGYGLQFRRPLQQEQLAEFLKNMSFKPADDSVQLEQLNHA